MCLCRTRYHLEQEWSDPQPRAPATTPPIFSGVLAGPTVALLSPGGFRSDRTRGLIPPSAVRHPSFRPQTYCAHNANRGSLRIIFDGSLGISAGERKLQAPSIFPQRHLPFTILGRRFVCSVLARFLLQRRGPSSSCWRWLIRSRRKRAGSPAASPHPARFFPSSASRYTSREQDGER